MQDAHRETIIVLTNYIVHRINEGKLDEARSVLSALMRSHSDSPSVLWLRGVLSDRQEDITLSAKSLTALSAKHILRSKLRPDFSVDIDFLNDKFLAYSRSAITYRNRIVVIPIIILLTIIATAMIVGYVSLSAGMAIIGVLFFATYFILVIHDLLSVFAWIIASKISIFWINRIELNYWTLLLTSANITRDILFRNQPRPEPYFELDKYTLAQNSTLHLWLSKISSRVVLMSSIGQQNIDLSTRQLFLLRYNKYSIGLPLLLWKEFRQTKATIKLVDSFLPQLESEEQRQCSIVTMLTSVIHDTGAKTKRVINDFCIESKHTVYMFEYFVELFALSEELTHIERKMLIAPKLEWKEIVHIHELGAKILTGVESVHTEVYDIRHRRISSEHKLKELSTMVSDLHIELQLSAQEEGVRIDDLMEHYAEIKNTTEHLRTLPAAPTSYTQILIAYTELSNSILTSKRRCRQRRQLVQNIRQVNNFILSELERIRLAVEQVAKELNFIFDSTENRITQQFRIISELPSIDKAMDEEILLKRARLLDNIKANLIDIDKAFGKSRTEYIRTADHEVLGKLVEELLAILIKHDPDESVVQKSVLYSARKNVQLIHSMKAKSEQSLDTIASYYDAANKAYHHSYNEMLVYTRSVSHDLINVVNTIQKTTTNWHLTRKRFSQIYKQCTRLRNQISSINNNRNTYTNNLALLNKTISLYDEIISSNQEYIEQLEVLVGQYNQINWRINNMIGSKDNRMRDEDLRSMLSDAGKYLSNAESSATLNGVRDNLNRAESILSNVVASIKYQANISGTLYGFAQGDQAQVTINFQSSGKPERRQLYEMGLLCANLCLKSGSDQQRKKTHGLLQDVISSTGLADIFPRDILYYLARDLTVSGIQDTLIAAMDTSNSIAASIKRKCGKRDESCFRTGFYLQVGDFIIENHPYIQNNEVFVIMLRELWGSLRSLNRKNDRVSLENIILLLQRRANTDVISKEWKSLQQNFARQWNIDVSKPKKA
jgi:hypothetical protein